VKEAKGLARAPGKPAGRRVSGATAARKPGPAAGAAPGATADLSTLDPSKLPPGALRRALELTDHPEISGSTYGSFTFVLLNQVLNAQWYGPEPRDEDFAMLQRMAAERALKGICPTDPAEGMLAAQMVAAYNNAMECFRRGNLPEQSFEAWQAQMGQANRLMRTYAVLMETLDRHRSQGRPQVVRVERVTVEAGAQAVIGNVNGVRGRGHGGESGEQPHAPARVTAEPGAEMRRPNQEPERQPVPAAVSEGIEKM